MNSDSRFPQPQQDEPDPHPWDERCAECGAAGDEPCHDMCRQDDDEVDDDDGE